MNVEAVLMSAYALATQERYEEAEQLLISCPEACNTVSGMDLLARIRHAQDRVDEAREIWRRILDSDPNNDSARNALAVIDNPEPDAFPSRRKKYIIAAALAVIVGMMISIVNFCGRRSAVTTAAPTSFVYVTNEVEKVVTKEVVKTIPQIVERVVTNIIDRPIEVKIPIVSVVTTEVERVVCYTNTITEVITNTISVVGTDSVSIVDASVDENKRNDDDAGVTAVVEVKRKVYNPSYIIKPGDQVLQLARKYSFRLPDFKAANPDVDVDRIRVGQRVLIPGFFDEEDLPR